MKDKLAALEAFRNFPDEAIEDLAGLAESIDLEPATSLFDEGDPGDSIFVIESGEIEIRKCERVLARLRAGQTIGEMAVLEEQDRSADAVATRPTVVYRFERLAFVDFLVARPECGAPFFLETGREMSRRLRNTSAHLMTVSEVGRIVASGFAVPELAARVIERILNDNAVAACGRVLVRHPLADEAEVVARAGESDIADEALESLLAGHARETSFQDLLAGRSILGATLRSESGEPMGAFIIEKRDDESPFSVELEIVLEAVAHQTEQGINAAWTRAEQADRERLERHRQGYGNFG